MNYDVSVIIPHHDSLDTLVRAVTSVINQTVKVREIIVIDDASSNALEVLKILTEKFEFYIKKNILIIKFIEKNKGVAYARNKGIEISSGDLIAFLDSDDIWHVQKIELQYEFMQYNNINFSYHKFIPDLSKQNLWNEFNREIKVSPQSYQLSDNIFILTNPISTPTVMVKKSIFKGFDNSFRRMEDYECWVKNSKVTTIYRLDAILAGGFKPPIGYSGLSSNIFKMHKSMLMVLKSLYHHKIINVSFFLLAYIIECMKYPIRILKVKF